MARHAKEDDDDASINLVVNVGGNSNFTALGTRFPQVSPPEESSASRGAKAAAAFLTVVAGLVAGIINGGSSQSDNFAPGENFIHEPQPLEQLTKTIEDEAAPTHETAAAPATEEQTSTDQTSEPITSTTTTTTTSQSTTPEIPSSTPAPSSSTVTPSDSTSVPPTTDPSALFFATAGSIFSTTLDLMGTSNELPPTTVPSPLPHASDMTSPGGEDDQDATEVPG
ncbi:hypothetical protein [Actinophytocola sp.]|uniref:hypothetical protein n=1 Tax=Actinophytocola sp. TaxID=1872138 RepID=UPI00389A40DB